MGVTTRLVKSTKNAQKSEFSWKGSFLASWLPYPATIYLLLNSKARQKSSYIETCRGTIRAGLRLSFLPFRYDEDSPNSLGLKRQNPLTTNIHYILHIAFLLSHIALAYRWYSGDGRGTGLSKQEKKEAGIVWKNIVNFYYAALHVMTIGIVVIMRKRADEYKPLMTTPFLMERNCISKGLQGYVRLYLLCVTTFAFTAIIWIPVIYFVATFWRPCLPFLTISMLSPDCPNWGGIGTTNFGLKLVIGITEFYGWYFLPGIYMGIGWMGLVYPGSAAARRIQVVLRELKAGNEEEVKGFREVQLMGILTNGFWKFPLIQLLLGQWIIALIISLFIVIRLGGNIPIEITTFFALVGMDGVALVHVHFKLLAEPCLKSTELFEYRKQMPNGGSRWLRRYIKSCSNYRMKMADGRFFDRTTSLVVWQFVVDRLVMCLLM